MDYKTFFNTVRPLFGGKLSQSQVNGINAILNKSNGLPVPYVAYILATTQHETANTMLPVRETLASSDKSAVNILEKAWKNGKLKWVKTPYWRFDSDGKTWLGRGYVQLTHKYNYDKAGKMIGVDLVSDPSRAMDPEIAAEILIKGSVQGIFTGKRLGDYLDGDTPDYVNARRVINGTDKASQIANLAKTYEKAVKSIVTHEDANGNVISGNSAYDVAKMFIGKHEVNDRDELKKFLSNSGQVVDPKTTAWCAAFINSCLTASGGEGTGSLMARSYLNWGHDTQNPNEGDIIVFERGKAPFGHVAFFVEFIDSKYVKVLGGNQSDSVCYQNYDRSKILGYRAYNDVVKDYDNSGLINDDKKYGDIDKGVDISNDSVLSVIINLFKMIFRK